MSHLYAMRMRFRNHVDAVIFGNGPRYGKLDRTASAWKEGDNIGVMYGDLRITITKDEFKKLMARDYEDIPELWYPRPIALVFWDIDEAERELVLQAG